MVDLRQLGEAFPMLINAAQQKIATLAAAHGNAEDFCRHNPPHNLLSHTHRRTRATAAADTHDGHRPHLEHPPTTPYRRRIRQQPASAAHTRDRPNPNPPTPA